jgi:hypothetical protein
VVGLGEEAKREGIGQRRLGFLTWAAAFICHSEEKRTTEIRRKEDPTAHVQGSL